MENNLIVSFDSFAQLTILDAKLNEVFAGAGDRDAFRPVMQDSSNLVCSENAGCAKVNAACSANVIC